MKALSVIEPWALLAALGLKVFETRSWQTSYTGQFAIHASGRYPAWAKRLACTEPFRSALAAFGYHNPLDLPHGAVLGTAILQACTPIDEDFIDLVLPLYPNEHHFGDFTLGRYAWRLKGPALFPNPIPARGNLGLWEWGNAA